MKDVDILVIGGGPAGLCAADAAASQGASVLLCERDGALGGQLIKQTHKFFGSRKQHAGTRGIAIANLLREKAMSNPKIEIMTETTAIGYYDDDMILAERNDEIIRINAKKVIIATGASENYLAFPGNDLPGVYGAGAVQTLMNVYGIKPGNRVLMIGASNIGLIISYQLAQAGIEVAAVIRRSRTIGGYLVHASKICRIGIPILTNHTIKEAYGSGKVEGAVIYQVDEKKQPIPGTEKDIRCDTICLAVGLTPLADICRQAGCEMAYIPELSGHIPITDKHQATTNPRIYAAGDASGVEEASAAMIEGQLAGLSAALSLGYGKTAIPKLQEEALDELNSLRAGPTADFIRRGLQKIREE